MPFVLFFFSVCHKLELERQQHNQLKHTWQRANDQFLESQRLLMRDMQRIESVLSSEQLRQVEVIKKKDQVRHVRTHTHTHTGSRKNHYNKKTKVILQPGDAPSLQLVFLSSYLEPMTMNQSVRLDIHFELDAE